jgi:DNA modification methylase
MEVNKIYNEPCLDTLKRMQDKSIDCVITSPPYWQLRDYGYEGQWGLEPTFNEYLEHLWEMMDEIHRVLKYEGTCWLNLGDSYFTQSGTNAALAKGKDYQSDSTYIVNRGESGKLLKPKNLPNKCLLLIPHRFAIGCIDRGWIMRNDIIWAKRNGMPESVTDRFTKKHEYIFFMTKSEKYYFDLDAIRDKHKEVSINRNKYKLCSYNDENASRNREMKAGELLNDKGKNPGSVSDFWDITTKGNSSKHYASYNMDLIKKPILAGCPEGGIIYDPFMGTGTTAIGAINSNRNFIGSEMSKEYIKICEQNTKPLLQRIKLF